MHFDHLLMHATYIDNISLKRHRLKSGRSQSHLKLNMCRSFESFRGFYQGDSLKIGRLGCQGNLN